MQVKQPGGTDKVSQQIEESKGAIEALDSSVPRRVVTFEWINTTNERQEFEFTQEELSFFGVQDFITLSTDAIKKLTEDELDANGNVVKKGIKVSELFTGDANDFRRQLENPEKFDAQKLDETLEANEQMIGAFFTLTKMLPDYQLEVLCMSLTVPRHMREWVKLQLRESQSRGGLSVKDGFDLMNTFLIQNGPVIRDFFGDQGKTLVATFREHVMLDKPTDEVEATATEETTEQSSPGGMLSSTSSPVTPANP